jgi:thiosulfate dehydrogenase
MGRFLWGLIIGLIAIPVVGAAYLLSGRAPAAVSDRPFPFEQFIAGSALHARISHDAPKRELASFSAADIVAGAKAYREGCGGCHGLPGEANKFPELKMFPPPPKLLTPDGYVTDDPVGVTYWKIKNGIRMTGMPSFSGALKDDQMWQISAMLASADKLPPDVMEILKQPLFPPPPPPANEGKSAVPSGKSTTKH